MCPLACNWCYCAQFIAKPNKPKNFGEDRKRSSEDMIADRQTHRHTHTTDRLTDTLITILRSAIGAE